MDLGEGRRYYFGVTEGMRKTRYVLIDEGFNKIVDLERWTTHIQLIDSKKLKNELALFIDTVIDKAKINKNEIGFIFYKIA